MRKLLLALLVLAVVLVAPLLLMRSEKSLLFLAEWTVGTFTDLRLVVRDPVLRPFEGRVSASEIHLYPKAADGPPFLSVLGFSGDITAGDLYRGNLDESSLRASQLVVYVAEFDQTSDPDPAEWLSYLGWLPERLEIDQVHIVTSAEKTFILPLQKVAGVRQGVDSYHLSTSSLYDGEPLSLELHASLMHSGRERTGLLLKALITAHESNSLIDLHGKVEGGPRNLTYQFDFEGRYTELAYFMRGFNRSSALKGSLRLRGSLSGDTEGLVLSDAELQLDNSPDYRLDASGTLAYQFTGESQLDLDARGELASMELLLDWLDFDLTPLGKAQGSARISGTLHQPRVEQFSLHSEAASGLLVTIGGDFDPLSKDASSNDIRLEATGPSLATLRQWLGDLPYDAGRFRASARLLAAAQPARLEDIVIQLGEETTASVQLTGSVAEFHPQQQQGLAIFGGADLSLELKSPDSRHLQPYLGNALPAGLAIDGSARLVGNGSRLTLKGGDILIAKGTSRLHLRPQSGVVELEADSPLRDLVANLALEAADTRVLSALAGKQWPDFGRASAEAQLRQHGERFALEDLRFEVSDRSLQIAGSGTLPNLREPLGMELDLKLAVLDPQALENSTGFKVSKGTGEFKLETSANASAFTGQLALGGSTLSGQGELQFSDGVLRKLVVDVSSPGLRLRDLGLQADMNAQEEYKPAASIGELGVGSRLENRLRNAPDYEMDIRVNLAGIDGDNTNIDGFRLHLTGVEKRYTLRQFSVDYGASVAEIRGIIDLNSTPSYASLAVEALALPVNTLMRDLGIDYRVDGLANIRGGLTARGLSGEELLRNLDGNLAVALEDAEIAGAAYDVLATDALAWVYSGAALEKSTHIECTMAQFRLRGGVADSDTLYIETDRMVANGTARVDFDMETMDVRFTPLSKSRNLQVPSSIRIKGPLRKPVVLVSPIAAAFDATAELLTIVPQMARKVFGLDRPKDQMKPCLAHGANT